MLRTVCASLRGTLEPYIHQITEIRGGNSGEKSTTKQVKKKNIYIFYRISSVYTHMDKRRLCVAHPCRGQASLTRSWCNEVALCRTSSSQQAWKSCGCLVCRTRSTTSEGPAHSSVRRIQPAAQRSPEKLQTAFCCFLFCPGQVWAFHCVSAGQQTPTRCASEPNYLSKSAFIQLSHDTGEVAPLPQDASAPWDGCSLTFFTGTRC